MVENFHFHAWQWNFDAWNWIFHPLKFSCMEVLVWSTRDNQTMHISKKTSTPLVSFMHGKSLPENFMHKNEIIMHENETTCMKLTYSCMKLTFSCMKMFMNENTMHKIVHSPISHEHFYDERIILGDPWAELSFPCMEISFSCTKLSCHDFNHATKISYGQRRTDPDGPALNGIFIIITFSANWHSMLHRENWFYVCRKPASKVTWGPALMAKWYNALPQTASCLSLLRACPDGWVV